MDMYSAAMAASLADLFAAQAARTPSASAIIFRSQNTSYGELSSIVEGLAGELSHHGVGPGVLVALRLQRTPDAIAAILAILGVGGAYLPLDPRDPPTRTGFVLSDSGAALLLTDSPAPIPHDFIGTVLELTAGRLIQRVYQGAPAATVPDATAYVIYTSGSSGSPKGVMLGHGATHLVEWARRAYSDAERSGIAATTSFCFDPSIFEIFVPLCTGGAMILKENALERFGADERPTMLNTVPSVLTELCRADAIPESLLVLNVGGEALLAPLVQEVYAGRDRLNLYNHYGPTEATTCVTVGLVPRDLIGNPSIGRPVRGAEIILLNADGEPTREGEVGEIHLGGPGLALGYLNRPQVTAERFVSRPWGRCYRTGDQGFWRDGELYFAGRLDHQVKVRGFRVELRETEAALMRIEGVERALVTARTSLGRTELIAYVQGPSSLTPGFVRRALSAWLPDHMLPAHTIILRALPVLPSGKVDRSGLPEPLQAMPVAEAPLSRMERAIILVFEEVLGRTGLGPNDSFFDSGGDSLSSVRAALRLEEVFGFELAAALIHQAPTPRAVTLSLHHARPGPQGHLALLQAGGPEPPIFCLADLYGQAFNYLSLAKRLARDRPVYGLLPGPLQDAFTRDGDIGALTETFKAEVRRIQPLGPYLIAGYSAAGVLAVDLACALERDGQTVRLVLLDACLHSKRLSVGAAARWAVHQVRALADPAGPATALRRMRSLASDLVGRLTPGAPNCIPRAQSAFAARMMKAGAHFRPQAFSGTVLMVVATERHPLDLLFDQDSQLGWSGAMKGFVVQTLVTGGHHAMMREPLVGATAQAVQRFLLGEG